MAKSISDEQLEELAEYVRDNVITCRLYEVRSMVLDVLRILHIEITVR